MKKLKNFVRRLGKTRFLMLCFVPFGAWGLYHHGVLGLLTAILGWCIGWWLGSVIYNWSDSKRRLKRFLRRLTDFQLNVLVKSILVVPVTVACIYYNGWLGLIGALIGIAVGEMIYRRLFKN